MFFRTLNINLTNKNKKSNNVGDKMIFIVILCYFFQLYVMIY